MPGMTTPSASTYAFTAHCTAGGYIRVRVAPPDGKEKIPQA